MKARDYHSRYPEKSRKAHLKRASKRAGLPFEYSIQDWEYALQYFHYCCAVCKRPLGNLFGDVRASADHWIPLTYKGKDNPGTVVHNIVPLCHGIGGCNNQKNANMPEQWLRQKYGRKKAKEIMVEIEAFFKSVNVRKAA